MTFVARPTLRNAQPQGRVAVASSAGWRFALHGPSLGGLVDPLGNLITLQGGGSDWRNRVPVVDRYGVGYRAQASLGGDGGLILPGAGALIDRQQGTLVLVGKHWSSVGAPYFGISATFFGIYRDGVGNRTGIRIGNSPWTPLVSSESTIWDGTPTVFCWGSFGREIWKGGELIASTTLAPGAGVHSGDLTVLSVGTGSDINLGLLAYSPQLLDASRLSVDPWSVFESRARRLYFDLPTIGGGDAASGGSSSTVGVSAAGAGSAMEATSGGASSAVDVSAAGTGTAVESVSGGASSGISVTSAGTGTAIEVASGGAISEVDVIATGAGVAAEIANGGNASLVEVSAAGAGTAAEQAVGGASSVVEITAAGAGAAQEDGAAVGGSSSIVDVIAVGAGQAAELAEGGSWSAVAVTAVGAGVAQEDGAAAGGSASRVEVVAAGSGLATEVVVGGSRSVVAVTAAGSGFKQEEGAQQGGSASLVAVLSAGSGVARERAFGGGAAFIRVRAFGAGIADDGTQIVLPPVSCTGSHLLSASAVGAHRRAATVTSTVEPIQ